MKEVTRITELRVAFPPLLLVLVSHVVSILFGLWRVRLLCVLVLESRSAGVELLFDLCRVVSTWYVDHRDGVPLGDALEL
jgi:hypothetical protein